MYSPMPVSSDNGGVVQRGHQVDLACSEGDATIYYTLDGSIPEPNGPTTRVRNSKFQFVIILSLLINKHYSSWHILLQNFCTQLHVLWWSINYHWIISFTDSRCSWTHVFSNLTQNPTYLSFKFDRSLTYKTHMTKLKCKVSARVALVRRLDSTTVVLSSVP